MFSHLRTLLLAAFVCASAADDACAAKQVQWIKNFPGALIQSKQKNKLILAYFSSSDGDEWGKKLEKEVLSSEMFVNWVNANVIPFNADFKKDRSKQDLYKKQNEDLMNRYQLSAVPTFLLLDADGEIVARAGYDQLKLLPEEEVGKPANAIQVLTDMVENRGEAEPLAMQASLDETVKYATEHKLPVLLMLTHGEKDPMLIEAAKLPKSQRFVRWVNVNTAFYQMKFPQAGDSGADAGTFKQVTEKYKLGPAPAQLVMFVPGEETLRGRYMKWRTLEIEGLMNNLQRDLPKIEYKGTDWLEDIRLARAILAQQPKRVLFLYFTDSSEFCQKFEKEILKTEEMTTWPFYSFVFVKVDYTKGVERPGYIDEQNKTLAELYGVRGYPYVILVNPKNQKIGESKYMKGGPKPFLEELRKVYLKDLDRRTVSGTDQVR